MRHLQPDVSCVPDALVRRRSPDFFLPAAGWWTGLIDRRLPLQPHAMDPAVDLDPMLMYPLKQIEQAAHTTAERHTHTSSRRPTTRRDRRVDRDDDWARDDVAH